MKCYFLNVLFSLEGGGGLFSWGTPWIRNSFVLYNYVRLNQMQSKYKYFHKKQRFMILKHEGEPYSDVMLQVVWRQRPCCCCSWQLSWTVRECKTSRRILFLPQRKMRLESFIQHHKFVLCKVLKQSYKNSNRGMR